MEFGNDALFSLDILEIGWALVYLGACAIKDIIVRFFLFLLMICEMRKIADLWGFHSIIEGI